ncbi:MAG: FAD-dependent oxidoreductase [Oscillospiraceae bacterium]|nr:FAD-dependent oxidoreductase [Oscillospiraceae bacterium]
MDIVENIILDIDCGEGDAIEEARKKIGKTPGSLGRIYKKSIDARHKENIKFVYSVIFGEDTKEPKTIRAAYGKKPQTTRPAVIGCGPAGMFCALVLAENGYNPAVFEMGGDMDSRIKKVGRLFSEGVLDEKTNVCFGEGGSGTFSDGKLTTRINDGYCRFVLDTFARFGAPGDILYQAKPHVGTDKIRSVTKKIREEISKNGDVYFNAEITDIEKGSGHVKFTVNGGETLETSGLFLAAGQHSFDLYESLIKKGFSIAPKPYSVGLRIEHKQNYIDELVYGRYAGHKNLPPGEYALSHKTPSARGVYTFCMCPGGVVVNSAAKNGEIVTNGMSYFSRSKENANAAVAVSVTPEDYKENVWDAFNFRKTIEKSAFEIKNEAFAAPVQTLGDYIKNKTGNLRKSSVLPSYTGKITEYDLNRLFPEFINKTIKDGITQFDKALKGYFREDAVLTAPETRTSSAVRILRDGAGLNCVGCEYIYPCGEGAGYAGGIMSSAVDGIKCAVKYMEKWKSV